IMVQLPAGTANYTIQVRDMEGRSVMQVNGNGGNTVKLPVSGYSRGYYVVSVSNGQTVTSQKVLKN
ncbi:MAG: T9SS type A sorting domain-containing protein, partial [Bacteroidota bacterium]|nr:T9SS type A sorting domain-containing protein [Bacteroidota bacterium]